MALQAFDIIPRLTPQKVDLGDLAIPTFNFPSPEVAINSGYPPLTNESTSKCNFYGDTLPTCSRAGESIVFSHSLILILCVLEFLEGVVNHPPAYPPYTTPVYSNLAYTILGFAYENITGHTIDQGQRDVFIKRLGMSSTTPRPPDKGVDAIIPRNESFSLFSYDSGIGSP
jgi:hypothetical protein